MNNKKIGGILLACSILLLIIFIIIIQTLKTEAQELGCFADKGCVTIENSLTVVHFAFGVFGFLFALAFYLIFFHKGEDAIVQRLEADSTKTLKQQAFDIFLKGLRDDEKIVVKAIHEQQGITQNTLRLRTNFSKAKLSLVITELERRNIIRREQKQKTFAVYLTNEL